MIDHRLRPWKDRVLGLIVRGRARWPSPNTLSVAAFAAGLGCAAALWSGWTGAALGLWVLNRVLDGLDGLVARMTGRVSDFGGYLDLMLDFAVYAAIPAALVFRSPEVGVAWAGFVLMAAFYLNAASWLYLAAVWEKRGLAGDRATSIPMPPGLVEGAETIVLYTLLILVPGWTLGLFLVGAGLTFVGAAVRFGWAAVALNRSPGS